MKNMLQLLFLLFVFQMQGQQKIGEFEIENSKWKTSEVIDLKMTNDYLLKCTDKNKVVYHLIKDQKIAKKWEFSVEDDGSVLVGNLNDESTFKLYKYHEKEKKLIVQIFNLKGDNTEVIQKTITIGVEKSQILNKFLFQNQFVLMVMKKGDSNLYMYKVDNSDNLVITKYDLKDQLILNRRRIKVPFHQFMWDYKKEWSQSRIVTNDIPLQLPESINPMKIYLLNNEIVFSIDLNEGMTQFLKLDTEKGTFEPKYINKAMITDVENGTYSNSFLLDDKIWTMRTNSDEMKLEVRNWNNEILLEKSIGEMYPNELVNTKFYSYFSSISGKKEIEFRKFPRKVSGENAGIAVYKDKGNYHIIFGGVSNEVNQNAYMYGSFGALGVLLAYGIESMLTPTVVNLDSSINRNVYYGTLTLNGNLENTKEPSYVNYAELINNKFDSFSKDKKYVIKRTTMRKVEDKYQILIQNTETQKWEVYEI